MTGATDVRPDGGGDSVEELAVRDDVFQELLLTLVSESELDLGDDAIKTFRRVIDRTVGDFLVTARREHNQDLWADEKFRQWTKVNTKKISRAAFAKGGHEPSADQLLEASNEVIRHAHDEYCASLPAVTGRRAGGMVARGPVCDEYVRSIGPATG